MSEPIPEPYQVAVEDTPYRDPDWQTVEPGYGQGPTMRSYEFDPIHGYFKSEGPKVRIHYPDRPE